LVARHAGTPASLWAVLLELKAFVMTKSGFAKDRLRSFVERIERLEEEKKALSDDIKEVYAEAKGEGFDVKIMRQIVRLRKMDKADYQEAEAMLELYKRALGMLD
jgi:uncharacterized protein (UPF0335 family)